MLQLIDDINFGLWPSWLYSPG